MCPQDVLDVGLVFRVDEERVFETWCLLEREHFATALINFIVTHFLHQVLVELLSPELFILDGNCKLGGLFLVEHDLVAALAANFSFVNEFRAASATASKGSITSGTSSKVTTGDFTEVFVLRWLPISLPRCFFRGRHHLKHVLLVLAQETFRLDVLNLDRSVLPNAIVDVNTG